LLKNRCYAACEEAARGCFSEKFERNRKALRHLSLTKCDSWRGKA
jgi:hypothetical protein